MNNFFKLLSIFSNSTVRTTIFASNNALKLNYKHFFRVFTMFLEHNLKEDRSIRVRTYNNILKIFRIEYYFVGSYKGPDIAFQLIIFIQIHLWINKNE